MKRPYSAIVPISALLGSALLLSACFMPPPPPEPLLAAPSNLWTEESASAPFCALNPGSPGCPMM